MERETLCLASGQSSDQEPVALVSWGLPVISTLQVRGVRSQEPRGVGQERVLEGMGPHADPCPIPLSCLTLPSTVQQGAGGSVGCLSSPSMLQEPGVCFR